MKTPFGNFKVYDTVKKEIVSFDVAFTSYDAVAKIEKDKDGLYLQAIGRGDRYVFLPEVPTENGGAPLSTGDILSNGISKWVVKFNLMMGIYFSSVAYPDVYEDFDTLHEYGYKKIGDIFSNPDLLDGKTVEVFL